MSDPLEMELSLARGEPGAHKASVRVFAQAGKDNGWEQEDYPVQFDFEALRGLAANPEAYGKALTGCLFADSQLRADFALARGQAGVQGLRLRLRFSRKAAELHRLRWELLQDVVTEGFLCTREDVVVSRFLPPKPGQAAAELPGRKEKLRAVTAAANPPELAKYNLAKIRVADEHARVRGALRDITVDLVPAGENEHCTLERILDKARGADLLYLACHGKMINNAPWIILENDLGHEARISGKRLADEVRGMAEKPRLVVLVSCESAGDASQSASSSDALAALGPRLVDAGIPAVLAMQGEVSEKLMEAFIPVFFREVLRDGRIDRALAYARRMVAADHPDWWMPALFMNLNSGMMFKQVEALPQPVTVAGKVPRELIKPFKKFYGRAAELRELEQAVRVDGQTAVEIWGIEGCGKTALAYEFADRVMRDYPDGQVKVVLRGEGAVVGAPGQPPLTPLQVVSSVLQSFGISAPAELEPGEDAAAACERLGDMYRSLLYDKRFLLLLDGAGSGEQIEHLIPPPNGSLVLVTGWRKLREVEGLYDIPLGIMRLEEGIEFLKSFAPGISDAEAEEIVKECDYLPAAIQNIGGLLKEGTQRPARLLERLKNDKQRLQLAGGKAALETSYNFLDDSQQRDWRRLAVLPVEFDELCAAASWGRLPAGASMGEKTDIMYAAGDRLAELHAYRLVELNRENGRYSLLNLARAFAFDKLTPDEISEARANFTAYSPQGCPA